MTAREADRWVAAALLVTPDGRYLMQLRDDKPEISVPAHWACFGGGIDPGEAPDAAMRRELLEELELRARDVAFFTELTVLFPSVPPMLARMSFFAIPVTETDIAAMVQHEGAGKQLFTPEALAAETRVAPWDLAAILMHARRRALFEGG